MRGDYYNQLRRHLEPENTSTHSKAKSIAANSQYSASVRENGLTKTKQGLSRDQHARDSISSFDVTALM